jgi:Tol biopolymer transport system component
LTVWWLSFAANGNAQVPIRINPATGLVDLVNGVFVDSRFPSLSADGRQVVFQVGNGLNAQIWLAATQDNDGDGKVDEDPINNIDDDEDGRVDEDPVDWRTFQLTDPQSNQPLLGIHPVISADGNHIAFASWQDYRPGASPGAEISKSQIYVLDRLQNRIVPISFLWKDTDRDEMIGMRDDFEPSNGNCVPVAISADGRIVVFLAQSPNALNIVDADGDGTSDPVNNPPSDWLILIHDRDADGNGVYDEAGIGATCTSIGNPLDSNGNYIPAASVSVSANGRIIAFATPDPINPEQWHIFVRDWQSGTGDFVRDSNNNPVLAYAPALSDDGTYLAYLTPQQLDNDGDGQVNEDPVDGVDNDNDGKTDEDPVDFYPQTAMDLVVRQLIDPATGQPPAQIREIRLSGLQLPPQVGTADGSAGWGYSDWWGAVTIAVDPTNPNIFYAAFHAWSTDLVDLSLVRSDLVVDGSANTPRLKFYQGVANIFLARFDFTPNAQVPLQLWRLTGWSDQQQHGLPVSLQPNPATQQYKLVLAPNLMPAISFVNPDPNDPRLWRLFVAFQSLAPFDQQNDTNGLWDIYLADVLLP